MFRILNNIFARLMRVSSIDEYCKRAAEEMLNRNQVTIQRIECYPVDQSEYNPALMERVYFGIGEQHGETVAFIVMVDENAGIPFGWIVNEDATQIIDDLKSKYSAYKKQDYAVNSFFFFSLGELEEIEELA